MFNDAVQLFECKLYIYAEIYFTKLDFYSKIVDVEEFLFNKNTKKGLCNMKKFVKILALMMALVLALTACNAKPANDSDLEYIKEKGELVVGITLFAPMNYEDAQGELTGFETEFAKAVAEKLGVTAKFQVIDWNAKETELSSKSIDCIWNGMTITDDRKATMEISNPYMANKQVVVVKAENVNKYTDAASMKDATVVAEEGSAGQDVATTDETFKEAKFTPVASQANVLMEVAAGTSDMGVIDYVMSIGSIGEGTDYAALSTVDALSFSPEEYGIAFRKGSDVAAEVNKIMTDLAKDGTLGQIAAKYKLQDLILVK